LNTNGLNQRLLKDAQLFDSKLCKIDGFGDMGSLLIDAVNTKTIKQEEAEAAVAAKDGNKEEKQEEEKQKEEKTGEKTTPATAVDLQPPLPSKDTAGETKDG
jgi:hypothetical protein